MEIKKFTIRRDYDIICKGFFPEKGEIRHIMIGVHGFAGDKESSMLKKLAEALTQKGAALICFDFPCHGESPVNENVFTVENCKKDLLAVAQCARQTYPTAKKSIFATSYGGYISLLCHALLPEFECILRAPAITMPELLLTNVLQISAEAFREKGTIDCGFERKIRLPYSFYTELQRQEKLLETQIPRSIHIFHGAMDDIVPPDVVLRFVSLQKHAKLTVLKGADHRFKNAGEVETIVATTQQLLGL